jgi:hypothetical protein
MPLIGLLFERKSLGERPIVCFLCGLLFILCARGIASAGIFSLIPHAFLIVGAIFWALPISNAIGTFAAGFYTGRDRFSKAPPSYSAAEGLVASGHYAEAIEAYAKIANDHPEEILPHLQTMKIWISNLQNPQAAAEAYSATMTKIRGAKNREKFALMAKNDFSKHIQFD